MSRIAITGGSGFVGGHPVEVLVRDGHEVALWARGVDDRRRAQKILSLPGVEWEQVGICDRAGLTPLLCHQQ